MPQSRLKFRGRYRDPRSRYGKDVLFALIGEGEQGSRLLIHLPVGLSVCPECHRESRLLQTVRMQQGHGDICKIMSRHQERLSWV